MQRRLSAASFLLLVVLIAAWGCSSRSDDSQSGATQNNAETLSVYAVNYPLKYFAERVGGEHVRASFPAPSDEDPAFWTPDPDTIAAYQSADLVVLNGADYAKWTTYASLPSSILCESSASSADKYIEVADAVTHSHGPGGEHAHAALAFTIWLDPQLASQQASAIHIALAKLQPENKEDFQRNFEQLQKDLLSLDDGIAKIVARDPQRPLVVSHPVYQYLTRRYGLNVKSVHWEPGEPPSEEMWTQLKQLLADHPAKWMIWEGQPLEQTVARLAEMGVQSVVFSPCGNAPASGDYLQVMQGNVEALAKVFADEG